MWRSITVSVVPIVAVVVGALFGFSLQLQATSNERSSQAFSGYADAVGRATSSAVIAQSFGVENDKKKRIIDEHALRAAKLKVVLYGSVGVVTALDTLHEKCTFVAMKDKTCGYDDLWRNLIREMKKQVGDVLIAADDMKHIF